MTTNQLPIRQCRYCCSDDMGLGWQHGEALKYHRGGNIGHFPMS